MTRAAAAAAVLLLCGCPIHFRHNAPGHIAVHELPRDPAKRKVETPADPGETVMMITAGGFGGGGGRFFQAHESGVTGFGEFGLEAGVHWACEKESHQKPDLFPFLPHPIPLRTRGVNAGASLVDDGSGELVLHDVYAEYSERNTFWGWGAGYGVSPDGTHGPHVQAYLTYAYVRGSWHIDRGGEVTVGMFFKLPQIFTWSR